MSELRHRVFKSAIPKGRTLREQVIKILDVNSQHLYLKKFKLLTNESTPDTEIEKIAKDFGFSFWV